MLMIGSSQDLEISKSEVSRQNILAIDQASKALNVSEINLWIDGSYIKLTKGHL